MDGLSCCEKRINLISQEMERICFQHQVAMECFGGKLSLPISCVDQMEGKSFSKPTFPVPVLLPIIWTNNTKCGMSIFPLPSLFMGTPKLVGLLWIVFGFTFFTFLFTGNANSAFYSPSSLLYISWQDCKTISSLFEQNIVNHTLLVHKVGLYQQGINN